MHTITEVIALAKASAHTAVDQWNAFPDSEGAHLINLYDTLLEHRAALERGIRKSFGAILKTALETFSSEIEKLAKAKA
jgi:hypothetical protein